MDFTCPGCGSLYNGNSQFCSRSCMYNNFDVVEIKRLPKRKRSDTFVKEARCDYCKPKPFSKERTSLKYCSDICFTKHMCTR